MKVTSDFDFWLENMPDTGLISQLVQTSRLRGGESSVVTPLSHSNSRGDSFHLKNPLRGCVDLLARGSGGVDSVGCKVRKKITSRPAEVRWTTWKPPAHGRGAARGLLIVRYVSVWESFPPADGGHPGGPRFSRLPLRHLTKHSARHMAVGGGGLTKHLLLKAGKCLLQETLTLLGR